MTEKSLCLCRPLFVVIHHLILIMVAAGKAWNRIRGNILEYYVISLNKRTNRIIFMVNFEILSF